MTITIITIVSQRAERGKTVNNQLKHFASGRKDV